MRPVLLLLFPLSLFAYDYPETYKQTQTEIRFGKTIVDDYKWMENSNDPRLWDWVQRQQDFTLETLDGYYLDYFYNRIKELNKVKATPLNSSSDHLASPSISLITETEEEKEKYKVVKTALFGGDLSQVQIFKEDKLKSTLIVKFYQKVMIQDDVFYYLSDRDLNMGDGKAAIFSHKIGSNQKEDKQIAMAGRYDSWFSILGKPEGHFLYVLEGNSYQEKTIFFRLNLKTGKKSLKRNLELDISSAIDEKNVFALDYNEDNFGKLYSYRLRDGQKTLLLENQNFIIEQLAKVKDNLFFLRGHANAEGICALFNIEKKELKKLDLPKGGACYFRGVKENDLKISYMSGSTPSQTLNYNLETEELTVETIMEYPVEVEVERVSYKSSTGADANIWVYKKKGFTLSETTPMIIYGYGGFRVTMLPWFNPSSSLAWLEKGGAFAIVSLPGSLTYGMDWWQVARKENRYHSWDSFALAGKKLIELGYTSSDHIGMTGGSNGGLLVTGTLQRHPTLFKAAVPQVGVLDLLNFNIFGAGKYWINEYGDPFVEQDFEHLYKFSPYHNLEEQDYSSVLVMTAEFDDRVVPMHSFKYAAKIQEVQTSSRPVLLYTKEWGGHSSRSGSGDGKLLYIAAMYTFFATELGLD